jgi:Tfp pilus assembly protein PilF
MKGAGLSRRRISPPHASQVVNGASEIRWRTSKTRRHPRHSYSYVGTNTDGTCPRRGVSRCALLWLQLLALVGGTGACSSTVPVVPPATQRLQAQAAYERGLGYLRDRQASLALGALREAVALDGTVPTYHNSLGLLLLELRRPDMAMQSFERALALDPGYADAHLNLGISLAEMGRWQEAVPQYEKALSVATLAAPSVAHQNLGLALYHLRQYREAEAELRFAISLDPRMEAAHYNLGLLLLATGRQTDARAAFQRVRDLGPETPFGRAAAEQLRNLGDGG